MKDMKDAESFMKNVKDAVNPPAAAGAAAAPSREAAVSCGTDEGEDSSTLVLRKSPRAESNSSRDTSSYAARSTPRRTFRADTQAAHGAKQLLDKIKEVEQRANDWAKNNADEQSGERVKELCSLREALCDDFAADLDLYIAFYCVSKELQEEPPSMVQA